MDDNGGRLWPLYFVFLITFSAGIIGLVWTRLFVQNAPGEIMLWGLLIISIVIAAALCSPRLVDQVRKGDFGTKLTETDKKIDRTTAAVKGLESTIEKQQKSIDDLKNTLTGIGKQVEAATGVASTVGEIGKLVQAATGVPTKLESISKQLENIPARLDSLEGKVNKLAGVSPGQTGVTTDK
jgi:peptidoglycan hydrolase CwlO-like protein